MAVTSPGPPPHPEPPTTSSALTSFHGTRLPIISIPKGTKWWRTQRRAYPDPRYFGDAANRDNRFDLLATVWPVSAGSLYIARSPNGAFIEVFGHETGVQVVTTADLAARTLFRVWSKRTLRLVKLTGPSLAQLHIDARIFSGDIACAQRWASAFFAHPDRVDGLYYPCRHDNSEMAAAIFERAKADIDFDIDKATWGSDAAFLASILDHYKFGLI